MSYSPDELEPMSLEHLGYPLDLSIKDGIWRASGTKPDVWVQMPLEDAKRAYPQYVELTFGA